MALGFINSKLDLNSTLQNLLNGNRYRSGSPVLWGYGNTCPIFYLIWENQHSFAELAAVAFAHGFSF